ncbi:hypothetical protein AcV7_002235 [Taiwanofungus camphoratus]|nr:hypothetical protein AcV7_002235 [Antrodia cinnamomea]
MTLVLLMPGKPHISSSAHPCRAMSSRRRSPSMLTHTSSVLFSALLVSAAFVPVPRAPVGLSDPVVLQQSPVTLPFARRLNLTGSGTNLVQLDRSRARALLTKAQGNSVSAQGKSVFTIPSTSQAVSYVTSVGIGDPPTYYTLLIDTGSSNTWVGANQPYVVSNTTVPTLDTVSVTYGSGYYFGDEVEDQITLAPGLTIQDQSLGVAVFSQGFDDIDGILGLGPQDLTCGTLFPSVDKCIPTVLDNAWVQGLLSAYQLGISFEPATSASGSNGALTFGGIDSSRFTGSISYVPITSSSPANQFVGIDQSVTYGESQILATTSGIVDTGTTLVMLATDAFNAYQSVTGGVMDNSTGLLQITPAQFEQLESLYFTIGETLYELTRNAQIWPRSLNTAIGGDADAIYLVIADIGSPSGSGVDFINGMSFLERFYAVYDVGSSRVGFANTRYTNADTN